MGFIYTYFYGSPIFFRTNLILNISEKKEENENTKLYVLYNQTSLWQNFSLQPNLKQSPKHTSESGINQQGMNLRNVIPQPKITYVLRNDKPAICKSQVNGEVNKYHKYITWRNCLRKMKQHNSLKIYDKHLCCMLRFSVHKKAYTYILVLFI